MTPDEMSRWITGLLGAAGLAALAFIIAQVRSAAADRADVFKQQIEALKSQIENVKAENASLKERLLLKDDRHDIERRKLDNAMEDLRLQIEQRVPVPLEEIAERPSGKLGISLSERDAAFIGTAAGKMKEILSDFVKIDEGDVPDHIRAYRQAAAKAAIVSGDYVEAAEQLGNLSDSAPGDWAAHLREGVAYANQRKGRVSDLKALQAYSQSIAVAPVDLDPDRRAKLFTYRGAMLKRLGRLDEARSDLNIAMSLVRDEGLRMDVHYNLAGVEAQAGATDVAVAHLEAVASSDAYLALVRQHARDYFSSLADHPKFQALTR